MSLAIPNTTATTQYVKWGGSLLANNGWIFAANGSLDIVLLVGPNTGLQSDSEAFTIPPGQSPLSQGTDEYIHGVLVRAAGGVLSTPTPQQYSGALFEPQRASIGAGTPFTGTVSSSGSITPGPSMINGITGSVKSDGTVLAGSGFNVSYGGPGSGTYQILFTVNLSAPPIVTYGIINDAALIPNTQNKLIGGFTVQMLNASSMASDGGFDFTAIVPQ